MINPATQIRLTCPACGRFLATIEGTYVEVPPCICGVQTTVRVNEKRLRVVSPGDPRGIEVK